MTEVHQFGHASTLGDHVRVLRRRKWIVIATTLVVTALALYMSSHKTVTLPRGRAGPDQPDVARVRRHRHGVPRADPIRNALTQSLLANGPAVAERVDKLPEFQGREPRRARRRRLRSLVGYVGFALVRVDCVEPGLRGRARERVRHGVRRTGSGQHDGVHSPAAAEDPGPDGRRFSSRAAVGLRSTRTTRSRRRRCRSPRRCRARRPSLPARPAARRRTARSRSGTGSSASSSALMLGVGLAFLWNALDTRIRGAAEVADRLGLPLLARVPEPPRASAREAEARDARGARERPGRGVPDAAHEPRVREPRARRALDHGHERPRGGGQVDDGRQSRRRVRPHRQAGRARRSRPSPPVDRAFLQSERAPRAHGHRARARRSRRGARVGRHLAAARRQQRRPALQRERRHRRPPRGAADRPAPARCRRVHGEPGRHARSCAS